MKAKGVVVATIPSFVEAEFGSEACGKWIAGLPDKSRAIFEATVLGSAWYPIEAGVIEPTVSLCDTFYGGSMDGAERQGAYSADHALKGVYKIFVKLGKPEFIISRASSIMPTYYQPSDMKVVEKTDTSVLVRISEFETPHTVIDHRIKGWMTRALQLSGVKEPRINITSSKAAGQPVTEFSINWG